MTILKQLWSLSIISFIWSPIACGQNPTEYKVKNPEFEKKLSTILDYNVPLISVDELEQNQGEYILLDTREREEFEVSHIQNAIFVGFNRPDYSMLKDIDKDHPVVTYCSVGYRSEKIGNDLKAMGFTNVFNLYGSIFEWVNNGYPVVGLSGQETDTVHTFNKRWSKWLTNSNYTKHW
ncbi:rhodanese-like domain-containing protein [Membranihabitans maritimus]|uniref:rhodanese-like domain-containing protein n=1 Tax=Membranihabitans maritimus TaxID=2904244 RepID=UPI001F32A33D|nr:rhodanese-like domain-containing protein [Membranihabitans maritimus]